MRRWRIIRAWLLLAASLGGAIWVYSYRATSVVTYVDGIHHRFHPDQHMRVQPWWSTFAAVAIAGLGIALFTRLMPKPERRRRAAGSHARLTS